MPSQIRQAPTLLDGKPMWCTAIHAVLTARSQGKCLCVTELIGNMTSSDLESDFLIYHDVQSVFTEKEARNYIASQFPLVVGRFVASVGTTNQGTAFHCRSVGDSLELARGLDSHGFADLDYAASYCCSLASVYPMGILRRQFWNQGTKEKLFQVME